MKLSEFKKHVVVPERVVFELWNGEEIPSHYHITEIWVLSKKFIDCGGEIRHEEKNYIPTSNSKWYWELFGVR